MATTNGPRLNGTTVAGDIPHCSFILFHKTKWLYTADKSGSVYNLDAV